LTSSVKTATATFPARCESLAAIGEFVEQAARAAGFDERGVYAVQMAVDEASSNIIEHAYEGQGGQIECSYTLEERELIVVLRDHGKPFDPACIPEPNLQADLQERDTGGLGIFFMCRMMDDVRFEFTEEGNVLTMVKERPTEGV
jgi:serine/threonine-protein kinase RsbW